MTRANIGIKALEVYIPGQCVNQVELEKADGVSAGKYTIGLGQTNMAFVNDREDIYSMLLTVLLRLLAKNNIKPEEIGRLEVGTETLLDKLKLVKSVLMQLLGDNADVEGIDTVNACYGGTNALFNAINWVELSLWDGRYAVVVCGDIAIYSSGAARPTGGAGTVAMLIGPDAPLVVEPVHGLYMAHAYDFFKPDFTSEYPVVDGHFSLSCYVRAVDACYAAYSKKAIARGLCAKPLGPAAVGTTAHFDYNVFHVPTCKLVTKLYARMLYADFKADPSQFADVDPALAEVEYEALLSDKLVEKTFVGVAKPFNAVRVAPSLEVPTNTGNMYTGLVYAALALLLTYAEGDLEGKRIGVFSYGSGLASSLYSIKVAGSVSDIVANLGLKQQLADRYTASPEEYLAAIELREKAHLQKEFEPTGLLEHVGKGVYYLTKVDGMWRRQYEQK